MPNLFLELRDESGESDESVGTPAPLSEDDALAMLASAEIGGSKLIPWGSNYSFAVAMELPDGGTHLAIYKPCAGEAPLYDFPDGTLYLRETAAYELSRWLGWGLVPPTIVREGPHGVGSVQLYVEPAGDPAAEPKFWGNQTPEIERMLLFDHVTINADRKIGHCLRDAAGKVWGIDHGLTFNAVPKLRTVLWQFVGEPVSPALLADLERVEAEADSLRERLAPLIDESELDAMFARVGALRERGTYPALNPRRNVPYGWW
ncbi:MAG: SCO1664 family protein [Chloroflexota bacterium]